MINVEVHTQTYAELLVTLDHEGIERLTAELGHLIGEPPDHLHLYCASWTTPEGADLAEKMLSGESYHWCHMLTLASVAEPREHTTQAYIDAHITGIWRKQYAALTATLLCAQAELHELRESLTQLAATKDAFSWTLPSTYELRRSLRRRKQEHNILNIHFRFSEDFSEKG